MPFALLRRFIDLSTFETKVHSLPKTLINEVDYCSRENINKHLFAYLECVVDWLGSDEITVVFLATGHTHESIDWLFSFMSTVLCLTCAITLQALNEVIAEVGIHQTTVNRLISIASWTKLCEQKACLWFVLNGRKTFRVSRLMLKPETVLKNIKQMRFENS